LLSDLAWMIAAMERVTRAFADPTVQTDVVEKGGVLSSPVAWSLAYVVLAFTDYFRPLLALVIAAGALASLRGEWRGRAIQGLWLIVPWIALSWMQRKASWYGIALLPPLLVWAAAGLDRWLDRRGRGVVWTIALGQLLVFSVVPKTSFPGAAELLRDPLPLHDWRLRRIEYLQPGVEEGSDSVQLDLDRMIAWMDERGEQRPVALMTMGTKHDYAARYYLQMHRPSLEVVNLGDPRVRASRYRSLHPNDFGLFVFLDDGLQPWPPTEEQSEWLTENLHCTEDDPLNAFLGAVTARSEGPEEGFYPLTASPAGTLGPGQVWSGAALPGGLCAR
jgi:hypothetical protein